MRYWLKDMFIKVGYVMNENVKRLWALANAILMVAVLIFLAVWPEHFFIIGDGHRFIEVFVLLVIASSASFLLVLFISSFIAIQKGKECKGSSIFHLIGSMLSLLFLMAVKVLADEIAHEWNLVSEKVMQHGEFWIIYACLGLVLGFMLLVGIKKDKYS